MAKKQWRSLKIGAVSLRFRLKLGDLDTKIRRLF